MRTIAPRSPVDEIRARHPRFFAAVVADARLAARYRGERHQFRGRIDALVQIVRLCWDTDAFAAHALYRAKARLQALGVPILPRLAHHLAMAIGQVCIGDLVVMQPGVYIAHGQIVIGGPVEIDRGVVIFPWVTIGMRAGGTKGPTVNQNVRIGSGAKLIGPVTVGKAAQIGANAVVVSDVPAHSTVVGSPARPTHLPGDR